MTSAVANQREPALRRKPLEQVASPWFRSRVIRPVDLDADMIAIWQQFCDADPLYRSPFYRPQFTLAVGACREDAEIAVFERGSRIVGFLPFHRVRGRIGKPIGGLINDYHGPIFAPGETVDAKELLQAAHLAAYDFNHLPNGLLRLAEQSLPTGFSPQMDLTGGFENYLASRDASWAKAQREVRRRQRKTEAEIGSLRFVWDDRSDVVFAKLVAMKNAQYARMGLRTKMANGWSGEVLARLRRTDETCFAGVTSALYAGDRLIAAHFGLRTGDMLHWWFPAYDLALHKLGPGISLIQHCAMESPQRGIEMIDFGKGDEPFKLHFANRRVLLHEGSMAVPGSSACAVRRTALTMVDWSRRLPLGRYQNHPGKIAARLLYGVGLPD